MRFEKAIELKNYSGTSFTLTVDREVRLISRENVEEHIGLQLSASVKVVAFETLNTVTNSGSQAWRRETGLLSIWILGMYNPSPATTVVIPYAAGSEEERGAVVNAAYFGEVPPERLFVDEDVIYFRG